MLRQQREYLAAIKPKTPLDVLRSPNKSLAFWAKEKGEAYVKAIMSILIADTVDFVSVGKSMRDTQIMQTIDLLLEDFSVYKIDFFIACFNNAKKGYYGKQYDRIDGQMLFEWLTEYEYEYQSDIEKGRTTEKTLVEQGKISLAADQPEQDPDQKLIEESKPVPMPDYIKEMIHTIATKKILPVKERVKTHAEIVMEGFVSDFNELYEKHGEPGMGKIVAFHGAPGKGMGMQEYIECRALVYENGLDDPLFHETLEECVEALKKYEAIRREKVRKRQEQKYFKKWK